MEYTCENASIADSVTQDENDDSTASIRMLQGFLFNAPPVEEANQCDSDALEIRDAMETNK